MILFSQQKKKSNISDIALILLFYLTERPLYAISNLNHRFISTTYGYIFKNYILNGIYTLARLKFSDSQKTPAAGLPEQPFVDTSS